CPVMVRGAMVGTFAVAVETPRASYEPSTVAMIEEFAARAAMALDNSILYREIQERDTRKEQFVAMLAHELRNPLGAISSAVAVLDTGEADVAGQARAIVKRQLQHLTQLVDDLLDTTRIATGKIGLDRARVNLAESVARYLKTLEVVGTTVEYTIDVESVDTWIDADRARIDQIVANLVGNAVKYTPPGGRISIRVRPGDGDALLEIVDTGVGMSPEVLAQVFDLFFQDDRSPDRRHGGLGIGLTLVRQLVELHGGHVEASSDGEGRGSRFAIRLPLAGPTLAPEPKIEVGGRAPGRSRILIVEDNEDARDMLQVLLSLAGHEVHAAGDGPTGLEMARATQPDIAVIDLGLPGLDGYELARRLRPNRSGRLRLLALSGYGQAEDRRKTLAAGFDMHLVKPVDPAHLSAAIASLQRPRDARDARDQPDPQALGTST
ncbi:MAG: ATP-binding protein, partial [Chloroflexi bacterium]|nr:ATP-binding protein [Chloroflexota bacterium]